MVQRHWSVCHWLVRSRARLWLIWVVVSRHLSLSRISFARPYHLLRSSQRLHPRCLAMQLTFIRDVITASHILQMSADRKSGAKMSVWVKVKVKVKQSQGEARWNYSTRAIVLYKKAQRFGGERSINRSCAKGIFFMHLPVKVSEHGPATRSSLPKTPASASCPQKHPRLPYSRQGCTSLTCCQMWHGASSLSLKPGLSRRCSCMLHDIAAHCAILVVGIFTVQNGQETLVLRLRRGERRG